MPRIRCVEIKNFRSIKQLEWHPHRGFNCLIGPGDSGKSTIIEAIDLCLGARRNVQFSDADFHHLDVESPIIIEVTLGELDDTLMSFDIYGTFLRGYCELFGTIHDEPEANVETVITVQLKVESDLEAVWSLVSDRAIAQGQTRALNWADRLRIAPSKIGNFTEYDLSWRKGSVLNRLSKERADASAALAQVTREARSSFGDKANDQLIETRTIVTKTAKDLGVAVGREVKAMLDSDSISVGGGTIALHDDNGIPLKNLGTGSSRLLVAGLQRKAAGSAPIVLIDELEHGLEPHRLIRFVGSLGAKEKDSPLQVFVTTHSPVAIRELSGDQLFIVRQTSTSHEVQRIGLADAIQGATRLFPEALLAPSVLVCEGATEVGFVRGLDQYRVKNGYRSIFADGVALVDGGGIKNVFGRALAFQSLGYRTAVFHDGDDLPPKKDDSAFRKENGLVFHWRDGNATEDELFSCLSSQNAGNLLNRATTLHGDELIDSNIKSASNGKLDLHTCKTRLTTEIRTTLGRAAKSKNSSWFKSVTYMEEVAREIVGPDKNADEALKSVINNIFEWANNASAM